MRRRFFIILFFLIVAIPLWAQFQHYNHPELNWRTIETDHFFVHFHQGTDRTAAVIAKIAEDIYDPVTALYDYEPDTKVHFIVRDHDDYSNGITYYYDNKIEMWAPASDFIFRGTHSWLRNTITHEFAHMVSLGAAMKIPRTVPAVFLQWFDYEKEKREDVIHGYPRTLFSFPLAGVVIPLWFAEGMAQFQRDGLDYELWDTHRDMLLRTAVMDGHFQSIQAMETFGKNDLGNERGAYNQGYGLTLYLAGTHGEDVIPRLVEEMKRPLRTSFSKALETVLDKSEKDIFAEWRSWLEAGYEEEWTAVRDYQTVGETRVSRGFANRYPRYSPDGKKLAYLSTRQRDHLSQSSLCVMDLKSGETEKLKGLVTSSFSWSPDGTQIVYAKRKARTPQGSRYFDLYVLDLETRKEIRITRFLRAHQPDWSPDGKHLVCLIERDGTRNLAVLSPDGTGFRQITDFRNGEQLYDPRWMDDARVVFTISENTHGRNIAVVDSTGGDFTYLLNTDRDERDAFPSRDGRNLYYSSDASGIFNIYRMDLMSGRKEQLTSVKGGAFMPAVNEQGDLVYSSFEGDRHAIVEMKNPEAVDTKGAVYRSPYAKLLNRENPPQWAITQYDDTVFPEFESKPYKPIYSKMAFMPRLLLDYPDRIKAGVYFFGNDYLEKTSIFGTVALNGALDLDVFGMFEYRNLYPTLFLEAYHQIRHSEHDDADYAFNLSEIDIGADWPLIGRDRLRTAYVFSRYGSTISWREEGQKVKFSYTYHIGNTLQVNWMHHNIPHSSISDIAPDRGRSINLKAERSWQRFFDDFEVHQDYGTLVEVYKNHNYYQFSLDWREYAPGLLKDHSLAFHLKGGYIDRSLDSFYNFFAGGLDGLRGYSYYSIEGRKLMQLGLAYRFPVFRKMGWKLGIFQFNKMYLSFYGEAGNAWNDGGIDTGVWKRDAGVQLRLTMQSFYAYPLSLFVDGCYGFDEFTHEDQSYGGEWRYYFGVLFGFLDLMTGVSGKRMHGW